MNEALLTQNDQPLPSDEQEAKKGDHKESISPNKNDVLCGRGGTINSHAGNEQFRQRVEKYRLIYLKARFKQEKRFIASTIVSEIQELDPSGRFLAKDSSTSEWYNVGDERARDKTSQALRENAPSFRQMSGMARGTATKQEATRVETTQTPKETKPSANAIAPKVATRSPYPPHQWPVPPLGYHPYYASQFHLPTQSVTSSYPYAYHPPQSLIIPNVIYSGHPIPWPMPSAPPHVPVRPPSEIDQHTYPTPATTSPVPLSTTDQVKSTITEQQHVESSSFQVKQSTGPIENIQKQSLKYSVSYESMRSQISESRKRIRGQGRSASMGSPDRKRPSTQTSPVENSRQTEKKVRHFGEHHLSQQGTHRNLTQKRLSEKNEKNEKRNQAIKQLNTRTTEPFTKPLPDAQHYGIGSLTVPYSPINLPEQPADENSSQAHRYSQPQAENGGQDNFIHDRTVLFNNNGTSHQLTESARPSFLAQVAQSILSGFDRDRLCGSGGDAPEVEGIRRRSTLEKRLPQQQEQQQSELQDYERPQQHQGPNSSATPPSFSNELMDYELGSPSSSRGGDLDPHYVMTRTPSWERNLKRMYENSPRRKSQYPPTHDSSKRDLSSFNRDQSYLNNNEESNKSEEARDTRIAMAMQLHHNSIELEAHGKKREAVRKANINRTARSSSRDHLAFARGDKEYSNHKHPIGPRKSGNYIPSIPSNEYEDYDMAVRIQKADQVAAGTTQQMERILREEYADEEAHEHRNCRSGYRSPLTSRR